MLSVECAFRVGVGVRLWDCVRGGYGLPRSGPARLFLCGAGRTGLVAEVGPSAEIRAGGGGGVGTQDGQNGLGIETSQGEFACGE